MVTAIISAILSVLGLSVAGAAVNDILSKIGKVSAEKIRKLALDINNNLTHNDQLLADFKTAIADQKAGVLSSLMQSMGYGPRVDSLRGELNRLQTAEANATKQVEDVRKAGNRFISTLDQYESGAQNGLIGAAEAAVAGSSIKDGTADQYRLNDLNQNVNGGLHSKGDN